MYNYIFWVLYSSNIEDGPTSAKIHATAIVIVAFFVHFILVISIIKKYFHSFYSALPLDFLGNKTLLILLFFISIVLLVKYYHEDRINKIVNKYSNIDTYMIFNKIKVALLIFIPLIGIIIILTSLPKGS
jgi:hypothetical protein